MAEVKRLLDATRCLKHQAALSVAYGAGLRDAEVSALKVSDIDSKRMQLRIERGKGGRYRNAMLPEGLLLPEGWLFPRESASAPISTRQLYRVVVEAAEAADIDQRVGPHTLRHSFASHLLEDCVDIRVIHVLLGHAALGPTAFNPIVSSPRPFRIGDPQTTLTRARMRRHFD